MLTEELGDAGVTAGTATRDQTNPNRFVLAGVAADRDRAVRDVVGKFLVGWSFDRSGEQLVFTRSEGEVNRLRQQAVTQAETTIRNRVDAFGVAEPVIQRSGLNGERIVVQLPGVDDPERVKRLIKNTAFLEFRLVAEPAQGADSHDEILASYGGTLPEHVEIVEQDLRDEQKQVIGTRFWAVEKARVVTGRDLRDARPTLGEFNQPVVGFSLAAEGAERFAKATGDNIGRGLAIILDHKLQSAPTIQSRIRDEGVITGNFTQEEVDDLVTVLKSGALPAGITYLEERTVGPSLGQDSIDQGLRAGWIGSVLVVVSLLLWYRGAGINAVLMLAVMVVLTVGALAYFGATLTLPGIAGIVLTIGMAVDANVLVFERIKEELHNGRTVRASIKAGFEKAWFSIMDSNLTTLLAAVFLFQFGTGPIRGFAVTLSIGILASMFAGVFGSRWLFDLQHSRRDRVEKLSI